MVSESGRGAPVDPSVGDEVTVTLPAVEHPLRGRIVDDYGDGVLPEAELGRNWAPARRWAIALESGRLVFADTADLTPFTG